MSEKADDSKGQGTPPSQHWVRVDFDPSNPTEPPIPRRQIAAELAQAAVRIRELEDLAYRDSMTGLLNRRALDEKLPEIIKIARQTGETMALVTGDVIGLKRTNDSLGQPKGDALLRAAGPALESIVRPGDIFGRMGGDEFFAVLPGFKPVPEKHQTAESLSAGTKGRLSSAFETTARDEGIPDDLHVGLAVGIVIFDPSSEAYRDMTDEAIAEDLLKMSDDDLHIDKDAKYAAMGEEGERFKQGDRRLWRRPDQQRSA